MNAWADFWMYVVFGALGLFAVLSIWVTIQGVADIKHMFAALSKQRDADVDARRDD